MNEKNCRGIIAVIVVMAACIYTSSCGTARPVVIATDESIIAGQVSTARIEAINGEIRNILSGYDRVIGAEQQNAIRGIDDALAALDRYDSFVQFCINRLRVLEHATRIGADEGSGPE